MAFLGRVSWHCHDLLGGYSLALLLSRHLIWWLRWDFLRWPVRLDSLFLRLNFFVAFTSFTGTTSTDTAFWLLLSDA